MDSTNLLFEAAARMLPARDEWIGWSETERERRLHLALSLVLPWIRIPNLVSYILSEARRQLPQDWDNQYRVTHRC